MKHQKPTEVFYKINATYCLCSSSLLKKLDENPYADDYKRQFNSLGQFKSNNTNENRLSNIKTKFKNNNKFKFSNTKK